MTRQTTKEDLTVEEIESAYRVLETVRENLSDDGMSNLSEIVNESHYLVQEYENRASWSPEYDLPEPDDVLHDPESNRLFGSGDVRVTEVLPNTQAQEHVIVKDGIEQSIFDCNPGHPPDAPVVKAQYIEGSSRVYTFPVTRLEKK